MFMKAMQTADRNAVWVASFKNSLKYFHHLLCFRDGEVSSK